MRVSGIATVKRTQAGLTRGEILVIVAVVAVSAAMIAPLLMPAAKRSRNESNLAACKENLRRIGIGLRAYAQDNGGALPVSDTVENPHAAFVQSVVTAKYVGDPKLLYCPAEVRPALSYSQASINSGTIGYFYYSAARAGTDQNLSKFLLTGVSWPRVLDSRSDRQGWVMSDIWLSGEPTAHPNYKKGVNFLTLDGSVGFVAESPRQAFH